PKKKNSRKGAKSQRRISLTKGVIYLIRFRGSLDVVGFWIRPRRAACFVVLASFFIRGIA
ncbi:MAG TPA: hypothetical protein VGH74_03505, partial [Planctomycetaceae bacterium]